MSFDDSLHVEGWSLRETSLDLDSLARTESLFALSNGHIGVRGNLDEGEPYGLPGTYLNGFHERRPLPHAEAGYGFPEDGQTVINVTNGKILRLLIDDEPFDVRYGELRTHERVLDFRTGLLTRTVEWVSPAHQKVRVRSQRLVSLSQRSVVAFQLEVTPFDDSTRVVLQSELVANEYLPIKGGDPRVAAVLESPLVHDDSGSHDAAAHMVHHTRRSNLRMAAAMDHEATSDGDLSVHSEHNDDWSRVTYSTSLQPGQTLKVTKYVAYGWSAQRSVPALRDQVAAALTAARDTTWKGLVAEQRQALDDFWNHSDVTVDGDPELQQAVRFALFHVLQASARAEGRSIPAKGLTGPGYDGHCFWDTETFVIPVLTHTVPHAVADVLRWRHSTLDIARARARQLGLDGAAFPWRTIDGAECSGYWPAGTAAFHVNADIADAVARYVASCGDLDFEREIGLEILVETARLWRSLGHHDNAGRFRIDGVTGPDEYSAVADNNVFTNLMAARNLRAAAAACVRHPREAGQLGVSTEVMAGWRDAADKMTIPFDEHLGVHPQAEGFTHHKAWDFAATDPAARPLFLHYPYFDLYRKQVVKQADLVLALHLCGDYFTPEQKRRDFEYYEALTVRDSSLSACTQAVIAAEVGHLGLAYDYACEAAFMDLHDLDHNTDNGLHLASLAGVWLALVAGMGGLRDRVDRGLAFAPRLPEGMDRLRFGVVHGDAQLRVDITAQRATYSVEKGSEITVSHHGEEFVLCSGEPVSMPMPSNPSLPRPQQPPGREPRKRRSSLVSSPLGR
jgi:alpha,alpha-trehalose phosphorylase